MKNIFIVFLIIILFSGTNVSAQNIADPDPLRFESQIQQFREWDKKNSFIKDAILFTGSSSVGLWNTAIAFPGFHVINRGFGGSHLSDVIEYYEQVIAPYKPSILVLYAGDNDVAFGKSKEQIIDDYKEIADRYLTEVPNGKLLFISIKPSTSRWNFWPEIVDVNKTIEEYNQRLDRLYYVDLASPLLDANDQPDDSLFLEDLLHLNEDGYKAWNEVIEPKLGRLLNE